MRTYYEFITDYLEELDDIQLIDQWNGYCLEVGNEAYISNNDEYFLNEMFASADDAVRAAYYGDYRYMDTYVVVNVYGNLESFGSYNLKNYIYISELASYLEENDFLKEEYQEYIKEN